MSLPNGTYLILNVRQNNAALLQDKNDGTPVVAAPPDEKDQKQQWEVTGQGNNYTIRNVSAFMFANNGNRAQAGAALEGRRASQQYKVVETRVSGQYTIATTDSRFFWQLPDNQTGSTVLLSDAASDQRSWWIFQRLF
ncbi:hypothetical protein AMATHDRAFT_65103 [Amanita thiersii Skay4041]|uniref:Ricin B lectin domain-containing protein n=1 Tax=Amanita thiersii Skay4041 TaxID=703135 RepID=A0A2A9NGX3_9AGAR|nr:hypothetical protein AMATHDRAFT_65103 [Amanita thiersii Skay4041]